MPGSMRSRTTTSAGSLRSRSKPLLTGPHGVHRVALSGERQLQSVTHRLVVFDQQHLGHVVKYPIMRSFGSRSPVAVAAPRAARGARHREIRRTHQEHHRAHQEHRRRGGRHDGDKRAALHRRGQTGHDHQQRPDQHDQPDPASASLRQRLPPSGPPAVSRSPRQPASAAAARQNSATPSSTPPSTSLNRCQPAIIVAEAITETPAAPGTASQRRAHPGRTSMNASSRASPPRRGRWGSCCGWSSSRSVDPGGAAPISPRRPAATAQRTMPTPTTPATSRRRSTPTSSTAPSRAARVLGLPKRGQHGLGRAHQHGLLLVPPAPLGARQEHPVQPLPGVRPHEDGGGEGQGNQTGTAPPRAAEAPAAPPRGRAAAVAPARPGVDRPTEYDDPMDMATMLAPAGPYAVLELSWFCHNRPQRFRKSGSSALGRVDPDGAAGFTCLHATMFYPAEISHH